MATLFEGGAGRAHELAEKLGLELVDLGAFQLDYELFHSIPQELIVKYHFIPDRREGGVLSVIVAEPEQYARWDELEMLLGEPIRLKVADASAIQELLEKGESTQRILDEATEDFRLQLVSEEEGGEESLSLDRIAADTSPIIKLVDSVIFNAIQRRASDIHIETRDKQVIVKYRIDGILYQALEPIDKRHHQTILSRIKVMSELDIAEKRIPQDGRFKLRIQGRTIDFRVSVMPRSTARTASSASSTRSRSTRSSRTSASTSWGSTPTRSRRCASSSASRTG
jgi:type IV pilus assembly protein PilB